MLSGPCFGGGFFVSPKFGIFGIIIAKRYNMKRIIFPLLAIALAFTSCKPDDDQPVVTNEDLILGSWWQESNITFDSTGSEIGGNYWTQDSTVIYSFLDDGMVQASYFQDTVIYWSWDLSGAEMQQVTMTNTGTGQVWQPIIQTLDESSLIVRDFDGGYYTDYTFQKVD